MELKKIIRKKLNENHDLINNTDSIELLTSASNSLADCVRYLECLVQKIENKECTEVLIKVLDMLRHPMGNSTSYSGFNSTDESNVLSILEIVSGIISKEIGEKKVERKKFKP